MNFYNLDKEERLQLVDKINREILADIQKGKNNRVANYFSDEDTYIRKAAYLATGKIWKENPNLRPGILQLFGQLFKSGNEKVRQTAINAAGEMGIKEFESVEHFFNKGLFDEHHIVRNAVIGSIKKWAIKIPHLF